MIEDSLKEHQELYSKAYAVSRYLETEQLQLQTKVTQILAEQRQMWQQEQASTSALSYQSGVRATPSAAFDSDNAMDFPYQVDEDDISTVGSLQRPPMHSYQQVCAAPPGSTSRDPILFTLGKRQRPFCAPSAAMTKRNDDVPVQSSSASSVASMRLPVLDCEDETRSLASEPENNNVRRRITFD